jgi:hypothetical protein
MLPANTQIALQIDEKLVSGVSVAGSTFKMQVTNDISVDDQVVIPSGTPAFGEVIDSKRAGMLGKAGVLVLSARVIRLNQRSIRLHSALGAAGNSNVMGAFIIPFIRGGNATVEPGTRILVHTAADERF